VRRIFRRSGDPAVPQDRKPNVWSRPQEKKHRRRKWGEQKTQARTEARTNDGTKRRRDELPHPSPPRHRLLDTANKPENGERLGILTKQLDTAIPIENFTGQTVEVAGQHYTKPLLLQHWQHFTQECFEVFPMEEGTDIFLPFWWVAKHPP